MGLEQSKSKQLDFLMSEQEQKIVEKFPLVSVIILNYNGMQFIDDCLNSVLKSTYPNYEVIFTDNLSTDESVSHVEKNFPEVKVFQNGVNGGYSLAYNNSFKVAKGDYYILLNNDVTVEPNWIEPLVVEAEDDPEVGALQSKLLSMVDNANFEYAGAAGGFIDKYGYPFLRGRVFYEMEADTGQYDDKIDIFWTTGAAMFVRATVIEECGLLDEDFVHHMEEIDWCYRFNLAGYKLRVIPDSIVYHFGGATIAPESYKKLYWNHRNSTFMLLKCVDKKVFWNIILTKELLDLMSLGWSLSRLDLKRFWAIIAAHWWLLCRPGLIMRKRKEVQKTRKVSDADLKHLLYPKSVALQYFVHGRRTYSKLMEALKK